MILLKLILRTDRITCEYNNILGQSFTSRSAARQ